MIRPTVTASSRWHFPTPHIEVLANGLTVWAYHLPGQHVAVASLVADAPLDAEPRDREGVATLALRAADEGTPAHPDGQISELIEAQGCQVYGDQARYAANLTFDVPTTRLDAALPLFTEIVTGSEYAERDIAQHRELLLAEYLQRRASPRGAVAMALARALWQPGSREHRPVIGRPDTIEQITRDDVVAFRRWWAPATSHLVIAGDFASDPLPLLRDTLGGWDADALAAPNEAPAQQCDPVVLVVDRPGAVQADVRLAMHSIGRTDPRTPAAKIGGHAMGGAFASRLNQTLREDKGYTYGVSAGFAPRRHGSLFSVGGSFRTEVTGAAIELCLDHLRLDEPFAPDEIADAQNYIVGVSPLANETASDIVRQASSLVIGRVDADYVNRLHDGVLAATPDEVSATFRELVAPERLSIAIAGDAAGLAPQLAALGLEPQVVNL